MVILCRRVLTKVGTSLERSDVDWGVGWDMNIFFHLFCFFLQLNSSLLCNNLISLLFVIIKLNSVIVKGRPWWRESPPTVQAVSTSPRLGFCCWDQSALGSRASSAQCSRCSMEESPTGPWWAAPPPPASPRRYKSLHHYSTLLP